MWEFRMTFERFIANLIAYSKFQNLPGNATHECYVLFVPRIILKICHHKTKGENVVFYTINLNEINMHSYLYGWEMT